MANWDAKTKENDCQTSLLPRDFWLADFNYIRMVTLTKWHTKNSLCVYTYSLCVHVVRMVVTAPTVYWSLFVAVVLNNFFSQNKWLLIGLDR